MGTTLQYVGRDEDTCGLSDGEQEDGKEQRTPPWASMDLKSPSCWSKLFPVCLLPVFIIIIRNVGEGIQFCQKSTALCP